MNFSTVHNLLRQLKVHRHLNMPSVAVQVLLKANKFDPSEHTLA